MADEYRRQVEKLAPGLSNDQTRAQAIDAISKLIDRVILRPNPNPDPESPRILIYLHGDLADILRIASGKNGVVSPRSENEIKDLNQFLAHHFSSTSPGMKQKGAAR